MMKAKYPSGDKLPSVVYRVWRSELNWQTFNETGVYSKLSTNRSTSQKPSTDAAEKCQNSHLLYPQVALDVRQFFWSGGGGEVN